MISDFSMELPNIYLPFYHVVSERKLAHIQHLYDYKNKDQFARDLDFFHQHFNPITPDILLEHVEYGKALPYRPVLLTFDDGTKEQYTTIAPMLKERGFSAIFFVTTQFLDNRNLFFRMKASLLLSHLETFPEMLTTAREWLQDNGIDDSAVSFIKQTDYKNRRMLDEIAAVVGLSFEGYLLKERPFMSSADVMDLAREGFLIGSHGLDHARFCDLSPKERMTQLSDSMAEISAKFNPPIRTFSFPFNERDVGMDFFLIAREKRLIDLSFGNGGLIKGLVKTHFPRFSMDYPGADPEDVIRKQKVNSFRFFLKNKNIIQR